MNKYDEKLVRRFAYLSNLELEILVNCKIRSYYAKKKAIEITKYLLEEYGYVGEYGIDELGMDREIYDYLRIAKVRFINVYKNYDLDVSKDDVVEVIKIYKDRDKLNGLNNEVFYDEMINSINEELLNNFKINNKKESVGR